MIMCILKKLKSEMAVQEKHVEKTIKQLKGKKEKIKVTGQTEKREKIRKKIEPPLSIYLFTN